MRERRKYERNNVIGIVRYALSAHPGDGFLKGITQNYSNSGLCLITRHSLRKRQKIVLTGEMIPHAKTAIVRWRQELGNGNFKMGMEFTK
jgi:hypothetical protein